MAQFISDDIKQQVIKEIRDEGKRVVAVAAEHNVSTKSIYHWLQGSIGGDRSALEIARLKRENEQLYGILGKVTAELKRPKR
jgi:transposase-like protein